MVSHNHYDGIGIFGTVIGYLSYVAGHALRLFPSVEQTIPALILAAACSFVGAIVAVFTKWLSKKFFKSK